MLARDSRPRRQYKGHNMPATKRPEVTSQSPALGPRTPQLGPSAPTAKPSQTELLLRRASELLGPSVASIYVAMFKVVMYCRNDPVTRIVDIAKALMGCVSITSSVCVEILCDSCVPAAQV